jgi:glycosyltransferase involved in cell wall biosynthesis
MKLSIITVNLNNKDGLEDTIKSVINQSYKDFEFLIFDGGSSDGSVEVIHKYSPFIKFWISELDSGIYNAMNKGIIQSEGEYLLFLNSGDILINTYILSEVFKQNFTEDIISGKVNTYSKQKNKVICYLGPGSADLTLSELLRVSLNHQATFIKRKLLIELGMYDESYRIISDWIFLLKSIIFKNASYLFLDKIIAKLQPDGISMNETNLHIEREKALKDMIPVRIYKDYSNLDIYGYKKVRGNKLTWYLYLIVRKVAFLIDK